MTQTIDVTIRGGFSTSVVDSGSLGTMAGATSPKTFTVGAVSSNQNVKISSVRVYVTGDPSFSADYEYSYTWSQYWDDSDGEVDVNVEVTWKTDPGNNNDVDLDYDILG